MHYMVSLFVASGLVGIVVEIARRYWGGVGSATTGALYLVMVPLARFIEDDPGNVGGWVTLLTAAAAMVVVIADARGRVKWSHPVGPLGLTKRKASRESSSGAR